MKTQRFMLPAKHFACRFPSHEPQSTSFPTQIFAARHIPCLVVPLFGVACRLSDKLRLPVNDGMCRYHLILSNKGESFINETFMHVFWRAMVLFTDIPYYLN